MRLTARLPPRFTTSALINDDILSPLEGINPDKISRLLTWPSLFTGVLACDLCWN